MNPAQAEIDLVNRLTGNRLSVDALDPWEAWKVFKAYLKAEVEGVYDAAAFQCGPVDDDGGGRAFCVSFVRQFSVWEEDTDVGVRRVVLELRYPLGAIRPELEGEVWTHDFPTLEEFCSVVEAMPQLQAAMSNAPDHTDVYGEEL